MRSASHAGKAPASAGGARAVAGRSAAARSDGARAPDRQGNQAALGRLTASPGGSAGAGLGSGQPLPSALRSWFEPRLGADLGAVRLHHGPSASSAAKALGAQAFTVGSDVVFGSGRYSPDTPKGRWLLAHELAHVGQARAGVAPSADAAVERDADRAASDMMRGRPARLSAGRDARRPHLFGEPQNVPEITYIAGDDPRNDGFLQDATAYHKAWGLKPRTVTSLEDIVDHLQAGTGKVGRMRVITHASQTNLYMAMFKGGSSGILETELRGAAESDAAVTDALLGKGFSTSSGYKTVLEHIRSTQPDALKPFGLDKDKSAPTGIVQRFFERSVDLLLYTVGTVPSDAEEAERKELERQKGVFAPALTRVVDSLRAQVAQPAPDGAGVSAADARALQDAIVKNQSIAFTLSEQDSDIVKDVKAAGAAIGRDFRGKMGKLRARFDASSWVDIRGCRVGGSKSYMEAIQGFFGAGTAKPHVSAPDWWQAFPTIGWTSLDDSEIAANAKDTDIQAALDQWFTLAEEQEAKKPEDKRTATTGFTYEQKLNFFFDHSLVLPVYPAASPGTVKLYMKHRLRKAAMDNWLSGMWIGKAPGLATLQKAGVTADDPRRVEAVADKDPVAGGVSSLFISPDPRYAAHIKSI